MHAGVLHCIASYQSSPAAHDDVDVTARVQQHWHVVHHTFSQGVCNDVDGRCRGSGRHEQAQDRSVSMVSSNGKQSLTTSLGNRRVKQVANNVVYVTALVTNFCELRGFNFNKRGLGHLCEATRELCLSASSGSDHEYVFGGYIVLQL